MELIYPKDPCMVFLPTSTIKINQMHIGKYTSPMDPMGIDFLREQLNRKPRGFPASLPKGTERTSDSIIHGGGASMFFPWPQFQGWFVSHYGSMGLVYLPTWMVDFYVNVGEYTIHGSYGYVMSPRLSGNTVPKMELLNLIYSYFFRMGFPLRMPYPYSLCRWGFLHFRVRTEMFGDYLLLWNMGPP